MLRTYFISKTETFDKIHGKQCRETTNLCYQRIYTFLNNIKYESKKADGFIKGVKLKLADKGISPKLAESGMNPVAELTDVAKSKVSCMKNWDVRSSHSSV